MPYSCGSAVADKVATGEELDESMFAVAGDGAGVADAGQRCAWRWVAGQAGEDALAERAERTGAGVELLDEIGKD